MPGGVRGPLPFAKRKGTRASAAKLLQEDARLEAEDAPSFRRKPESRGAGRASDRTVPSANRKRPQKP